MKSFFSKIKNESPPVIEWAIPQDLDDVQLVRYFRVVNSLNEMVFVHQNFNLIVSPIQHYNFQNVVREVHGVNCSARIFTSLGG